MCDSLWPPQGPRHRPTVGSYGGGLSDERGTHIQLVCLLRIAVTLSVRGGAASDLPTLVTGEAHVLSMPGFAFGVQRGGAFRGGRVGGGGKGGSTGENGSTVQSFRVSGVEGSGFSVLEF